MHAQTQDRPDQVWEKGQRVAFELTNPAYKRLALGKDRSTGRIGDGIQAFHSCLQPIHLTISGVKTVIRLKRVPVARVRIQSACVFQEAEHVDAADTVDCGTLETLQAGPH